MGIRKIEMKEGSKEGREGEKKIGMKEGMKEGRK